MTQSVTNLVSSSSNISSKDDSKTRFMFEESKISYYTNALFEYFSFSRFLNAHNRFFIFFFSFWRLSFYFLPSLLLTNFTIHRNSPISNFLSLLGNPGHYLPKDNQYIYLSIFYIASICIILGLLIKVSLGLVENKRESISRSTVVLFLLDGPFVILQPMITTVNGVRFGINIVNGFDFIDLRIVLFSLDFVLLIFSIYFFYNFSNVNLSIQSGCLEMIMMYPQTILLSFTCLLSFLSTFATYLPPKYLYIVIVSMIIVYTISLLVVSSHNLFLDQKTNIMFNSLSSVAILSLFANMYLVYTKKSIIPYWPIIYLGFFAIFYIIFNVLYNFQFINALSFLDAFEENTDLINDIPNVYVFLKYACFGIIYAHPSLVEWGFFISWKSMKSSNLDFLFFFAKALSGIPQEINNLALIRSCLESNYSNLTIANHFRHKISSIIIYRDGKQSQLLEQSLKYSQKLTFTVEKRLHTFWDCVYQGNINDIKLSNLELNREYIEVKNYIKFLLKIYPNNVNCINQYYRFHSLVRVSNKKVEKWRNILNSVKNGHISKQDQLVMNAFNAFPNFYGAFRYFPSQKIYNSSNFTHPDNDISDEIHNSKIIHSVEPSIYSLKTPFLSWSRFLLSIELFLVFLVFIPSTIYIFNERFAAALEDIRITYSCSILRDSLSRLIYFSPQHLFRIIYSEQFVDLKNISQMQNITYQMKIALDEVTASINVLRNFSKKKNEGSYIARAFQLFFEEKKEYTYFTGNSFKSSNISDFRSIESAILIVLMYSAEVISVKTKNEASLMLFESSIVDNIASYTFSINEYLNDVLSLMEDHSSETILITKSVLNTLILIGIVGSVIYSILFVCFTSYNYNSAFHSLCQCYLMIKKETILSLIGRIESSTSEDLGFVTTDHSSENNERKEEQNIMRTLSTTNSPLYKFYGPILRFVFTSVFFVFGVICFTMVGSYRIYEIWDVQVNTNPFLNQFLSIHTNFVLSYVNTLHVINIDQNGSSSLFRDLALRKASEYFSCHIRSLSNVIFGVSELHSFGETYQTSAYNSMISAENPNDFNFSRSYTLMSIIPFLGKLLFCSNMLLSTILRANITTLNMSYENANDIWNPMFEQVYYPFFNATMENYLEMVLGFFRMQYLSMFTAFLFFSFYGIVFYFFLIRFLEEIRSQIVWILKPLIQVDFEQIIKSKYIMSAISGNIINSIESMKSFPDSYFKNVLSNVIKDSVIRLNNNLIIVDTDEFFDSAFAGINAKNKKLDVFLREIHVVDKHLDEFLTSFDNAVNGRTAFKSHTILKLVDPFNGISSIRIDIFAQSKNGLFLNIINTIDIITEYIIIISDNTKEDDVFKEYEVLKEKASKIIGNWVPERIFQLHTKRGNPEMSFVRERIIIAYISIDIVGYVHPSQIIAITNVIYSKIANLLAENKKIIKIKSDSRVLMIASGVFSRIKENTEQERIISTINFCIQAIKIAIEWSKEIENSIFIKSSLHIGGPVTFVSVMNLYPMFDAYGDSISLCEHLLNKSEKNSICITQDVHMHVLSSYDIKQLEDTVLGDKRYPTYCLNVIK